MNHVWSLNSIFWIAQYSSISKFRTTSKSKTKVAETFLTLSRPVEQGWLTFAGPCHWCLSPMSRTFGTFGELNFISFSFVVPAYLRKAALYFTAQ